MTSLAPLQVPLGWNSDLLPALPVLTLLAGTLAVCGVDVVTRCREVLPRRVFLVAYASLLLTGLASIDAAVAKPRVVLGGALYADSVAWFFDLLFCLIAGGVLVVAWSRIDRMTLNAAEYAALVLFSTTAMMILARSADLLTLFLALEAMSIPVYVLACTARKDVASREAALKYFVMGSFSSALFLYGAALVYGTTAGLSMARTAHFLLLPGGLDNGMLAGGVGLLLCALAFKVAAVPFHMWTPDVYEGSDTSVVAFMATGVKAAAFSMMFRVVVVSFGAAADRWAPVVAGLAILSMVFGNVAALAQTNLKRMLAYSSIGHAGYLLVGVVTGLAGGEAFLFYLLAYALTTLGAFACLMWFGDRRREAVHLSEIAGAGRQRPLAALGFAVMLLSLAGFPPTAGFAAKFGVFGAAVRTGWTELAIVGVLTSLIAMYYYVRVIVTMFMPEKEVEVPSLHPVALSAAITLCAAAVLLLGLFPGFIWEAAGASLSGLG